MGARGHHGASKTPACAGCRSEDLAVIGPVKIVKGIERVPVKCGGCDREWLSENRRLVERAPAA